MTLYARQGDVGLVCCSIPRDAHKISVRPLALGEVTGHKHQVAVEDLDSVEMYEQEGHTYIGNCKLSDNRPQAKAAPAKKGSKQFADDDLPF